MAQLSSLLDRVNDEFPTVPRLLALRMLSDSAKEFLTRTHAWQETLTPVALRPGVFSYELAPDSGVQVASLREVRLDGRRVDPIASEIPQRWGHTLSAGRPDVYTQIGPSTIQLWPSPDAASSVTVLAALTLALSAPDANIPDDVVGEYGEAIASGAKMRLVRQANKAWFAPDAAAMYGVPYYQAIADAKRRTMTALDAATVQLQMRPW